jgi:hypothetical protein
MLSEWIAYKIGKKVQRGSDNKSSYEGDKPGLDIAIECIAAVFVIIIFFILLGS